MSLNDKLRWRYATKKFDSAKKVPADKLNAVLDAIQLSPSSYGLQHYRIVVVEDAGVRAKLSAAAYGQTQITEASQLIVFAAETNINADFVGKYIDNIAAVRGMARKDLSGFEGMMVGTVNGRTPQELLIWAQKQAYLALGVLITAASDQDIDVCPIEGFDAAQFDELLGLTEKGLTATVIAAIGYRADDDATSHYAKVRRPKDELFIKV